MTMRQKYAGGGGLSVERLIRGGGAALGPSVGGLSLGCGSVVHVRHWGDGTEKGDGSLLAACRKSELSDTALAWALQPPRVRTQTGSPRTAITI
jgi:hypothetical protein